MHEDPNLLHTLITGDETPVMYRLFPAVSDPQRGSIIYLHGIQSHGAWYVETAAELARHGYSVYLPDRRGSGRNRGPRGFFHSRMHLIDDVRRFVALSQDGHPGCPTFIIGNCWGAKPALAFALQAQEELAGLVLLSPALKTRTDLSLRDKVKVLVGQMLSPASARAWRVRLPLTPEMFTSNPTYLQFIREDPLALREVSPRFCFESFLWDHHLRRQRQFRLPLLLMQGGRDPIVDVEAVRRWFNRVVSRHKQYRFYPNFGHTLDFEEQRQQYWNDLLAWLDVVERDSAGRMIPTGQGASS
jgi:acylglycerol lipase